MNHIKMRRIALVTASFSFSVLTTVVMLLSTVLKTGGEAGETVQLPKLQLPTPISCTPLVVEQIASYDGKFIEDGSEREVVDVAAIMLRNSSHQVIPYACVTVYTESCRYTFDAFLLPPEASVLVPEASGQKLSGEEITRIFGWMTVKNAGNKPELAIRESGADCLQIENHSGFRLQDFKVYYRTYIADGDFFIGGRVYEAVVPELPPGEMIVISPPNYVSGYSQVVYYE